MCIFFFFSLGRWMVEEWMWWWWCDFPFCFCLKVRCEGYHKKILLCNVYIVRVCMFRALVWADKFFSFFSMDEVGAVACRKKKVCGRWVADANTGTVDGEAVLRYGLDCVWGLVASWLERGRVCGPRGYREGGSDAPCLKPRGLYCIHIASRGFTWDLESMR